jgi:4-amino-4-deoxy-L-arabinose transferase-like glycosyltransferase
MKRSPATFARSRRSSAFGLVCLFLALWFGTLDERELFHPDEGRYAEIPREMLASGDWITPRLNGLKYFEKPVLQYWITATSYWLLGEEEFVARLWPAVAGLLTLLVVYYTGRRLVGVRAGLVAAAALASTFQFFVFSQLLTLDMGLTFFMTLALSAFFSSQDKRGTAVQRRNWAILMWIAMGLALLSKGLVGVVAPALVLVAHVVIARDWKLLGRMHWGLGLLALLAVALPWFIAVQLRNPEFFQFFFIREHFARFALKEHHRPGAWYYFLVVLLVGSLPWSFAYLKAALGSWRKPAPQSYRINPIRVLVLWVVTITLFYSVSASKLPGYVLPVYPALALLLGCTVQRERWSLSPRAVLAMAASGIAIAAAAPLLTRVPKFAKDADLIAPYLPWAALGGSLLAGAAVVAMLASRRHPRFALGVVAFGALMSFQVLLTGTQSIEDAFSSKDLVDKALDEIGDFDPQAPFYSIDMYDQTLPPQLGRTLTMVNYSGELAMGIAMEPKRAVASIEEFRRLWRAHAQAYAIMTLERFEQERSAGTPLSLLAANRKAAIVAREASAQAPRKSQRPDR